MRFTGFQITMCGELLTEATTAQDAALAATICASRHKRSAVVTAIMDDGRIRQVVFYPDGSKKKLWENDHIIYTRSGEDDAVIFPAGTCEDEIFTEACRMICFGDCSGVSVEAVIIDGKRYTYGGWLPGMRYAFYDADGTRAWMDCFPEWDH